jgi:hypothetical protein
MIKKTFIAAIIFFALHALFVRILPISNSQHQWQDNIVKAQHFIYSKDTIQNIIIGSSLSNRLIMDSLPDYYNFSLQGQSIYEGLHILSKLDRIPPKIYIEMNIILGKENEDFVSSLYSPILYTARKLLPSLKDEYQPVGQIGKLMINFLSKINPNSSLLQKPSISGDLFNMMLQHKIDQYSTVPDKELLNNRFSIIQKYVNELEKRGSKVIFFEMPLNEKLYTLVTPVMIREYFYKTFPFEKYNYIKISDYNGYVTRDGIHLEPEEALRYTLYFKSQLKDLN